MKSALKDDPSLLANWNVVKRVQRTIARAAITVATSIMPPTTRSLAAPTAVTPANAPVAPARCMMPAAALVAGYTEFLITGSSTRADSIGAMTRLE